MKETRDIETLDLPAEGPSRKGRACVFTSRHILKDIRIYRKECLALAAAGWEVRLLALRREASGLQTQPRLPWWLRLPRALWRTTSRVLRVYRAAAREKADIYHFHDPELVVAGVLLRLGGRRVLYDIHEDFPRQLADGLLVSRRVPPYAVGFVEKTAEFVEDFCASRLSGLVPATPAIARRFARLGRPLELVRNLPKAGELRPLSPHPWSERDQALAFAGGISKLRGILPMVDALALVPESRGLRLKLMGDFSPATFRAELERSPGWKHVDYLGNLDRESMRDAMARSRAGLLLFQPAGNHTEALPNKLFEYMDAGLPLIASDFPLWRDLLGNLGCAILVPPSDPAAIAEAMGRLMDHPEEAEAMGRRGQEAVDRELSWGRESEKLVAFYQRLMTGRG